MQGEKLLPFSEYGQLEPHILPPSIIPVVILRGSDYQMGYQYGQQAAPYIEWKKNAAWAGLIKLLGSREKVMAELKARQHYIKAYVPEAMEGMKGIADGASAAGYKISTTDVFLINTRILRPTSNENFPPGVLDKEMFSEECSVFSAWGSTTTDGRLVCAKSSDSEFEPQVAILAFPDKGNNYLAAVTAGELAGMPCINNKGVFMGTSGGFPERDVDFDCGVPMSCGSQYLLRFTDSALETKDVFMPWKYSRGTNFHFSDVHGNAFVIEATAAVKRVRKAGDFGETDFLYSTNNYFIDEMKDVIKAEKYIEHAGWLGKRASIHSVPRNLQLWNMLYNYQGNVDLEFVKMMWRFPGDPPPYPLDEKDFLASKGKLWDQKIGNQDNRRIGIMIPDKGDKGVAYICTGPASRTAHPLKPKGGDWYQIAGTHSFYQLVLAASPAEVVEAAREEAHACIASMHRELMGIDYGDVRYEALNKIYSQANAEYYQGIYAYNRGCLASGDEALRCYAYAATAFTRSQAHSRQVYNVLVPPASRPEDLRLRPYGGSWATWAGRST